VVGCSRTRLTSYGADRLVHWWNAAPSTPLTHLSTHLLQVSISVWSMGSIYSNLEITGSKCSLQPSSCWFFSLPFHHHRARSTQTAPAMSQPPTNADRARIRAHRDAFQNAMAAIPEFDLEKVRAAREAVDKAHPISKDLWQAYSAEQEAEMAEPLKVLPNSLFLKPDAPWGLAVYRVSYSDDAAWDRMLSVLRQDVESSLAMRRQAQPDLCSRHELVVIDDASKFDGAGPDKIREHFNAWAVDELQRNWRTDREPATKDEIITGTSAGSANHYLSHAGSRYNFCWLIDDICLESLEKMTSPVVKLVSRDWAPDSEQDEAEEDEEDEKLDWEGGETNGEFEDVGWMYVEVCEYINIQNQLLEDDFWPKMYVRPPLMRFESDFNEAPGFWRRSASSA
jgi:hypothetical protein